MKKYNAIFSLYGITIEFNIDAESPGLAVAQAMEMGRKEYSIAKGIVHTVSGGDAKVKVKEVRNPDKATAVEGGAHEA